MEFLSEDPTYLVSGLGLIAVACLVALRLTQQGKYLVAAGGAVAAALLVLAVERVWVTDNERVEAAVYGLGKAVAASDVPSVLARLTPDVQYVVGGRASPSAFTRTMIKQALANSTFDFLRVTHLRANAGGQSRRGTAEFRVLCGGSFQGSVNTLNFGSHNSQWTLGLRETSPGVWKIQRITPLNVPGGQTVLPASGF